jgi:hypothetical protein
MKTTFLLSATRKLALVGLLAASSLEAQAAALFTLKGEAFDARYPEQSEIRLSVSGWTAPEKLDAIEAEYQTYSGSQDHTAFQNFLQLQDTQGYLFTKAATGHTIKYAWQEGEGADARMVLMVTPALKARTPHMWNTPNNDPAPFSLVEIQMDGSEFVMKTSLDNTAISADDAGRLQLENFDAAPEFGRLTDATPYYLKTQSTTPSSS